MNKGFSLIESLIALTITLVVAASAFQLFRQSERLLRDQEIVTEMNQSARAAAFQIADDFRLAGQGVPVYSSTFDATPDESTTVVLSGSSSSRANIRAGISGAQSQVVSTFPLQLRSGNSVTLTIQDAAAFTNTHGSVYLFGLVSGDVWAWSRASLDMASAATNTIVITPMRTVQFDGPLTVSLEEAIAIFYDPATGAIRRTTATDLTDPANPMWAPANELSANAAALAFTYYDRNGQQVAPSTLANRNAIVRVEFDLTIQATAALASGVRPSSSVHLSPFARNLSNR